MGVTIREIREQFFRVADWIDPKDTCDQILAGDPDRDVTRVATGWTPCAANLRAAAADGCELFVTHEALYFGEWAPETDSADTPWGRQRAALLHEHGMACMRQHDTWDNFPQHGIRDAWRDFLGLGELIAERPYYYRGTGRFAPRNSLALSRIEPCTLRDLARDIADRCRIYPASHGVTMHGDAAARIETVATGVGCHIPTLEMLALGADALVVTFDRGVQTLIRGPLAEMGANVLCVEHGVSEMPGMQRMADYLETTFPSLTATCYCLEPPAETVV